MYRVLEIEFACSPPLISISAIAVFEFGSKEIGTFSIMRWYALSLIIVLASKRLRKILLLVGIFSHSADIGAFSSYSTPPWGSFLADSIAVSFGAVAPSLAISSRASVAFATNWASLSSLRVFGVKVDLLSTRICLA